MKFLRCLAFFALMICPALAEIDRALQLALEKNYANWRNAYNQKDTAQWLKHTSKYRQMMLRNQVLSQKLPWPRAVFSLALQPPSIIGLKTLDARAVGDCARITYYGRVDFNIAEASAPDNVLLLWFLKEGGEWKYNTAQYVNLGGKENRAKVAAGDLSFLQEEEFAMAPAYPAMPKPCEEPYHVCRLHVISKGYKVSCLMNGANEEIVKDNQATRVVIGGLRKGPNKFTVIPTVTEADPKKRQLVVRVTIYTGNPGQPEREVLNWKLEEGKVAEKQEWTLIGPSNVLVN